MTIKDFILQNDFFAVYNDKIGCCCLIKETEYFCGDKNCNLLTEKEFYKLNEKENLL